MSRRIILYCLAALILLPALACALSVSGAITGGEGLPLRYIFAVPSTLDTIYFTIAIPVFNTYTLPNVLAGSYVLWAYQDLNTNLIPDLDEPRGFYGGDVPQMFILQSDTTGVNIELHPPNTGGFSGTITYEGTQTGATYLLAYYNAQFEDTAHGGAVLLNNTGNGSYVALVDSFTTYYAYAYMDLNINFRPDPNEPYGVYGGTTPAPIHVEQTDFPDDVDITLLDPAWTGESRAPATSFSLGPVYPNPFNSRASVSLSLPVAREVDLALYDLLGRRVRSLARGPLSAGTHSVTISAEGLPSGIYYVRLSAVGMTTMQPALLIR